MTVHGRPSRGNIIAAYWDAWEEQVYRRFSATTQALDEGEPMLLVDHGPVPEVPETSSDVPPWKGRVDGALVDAATAGDPRELARWLLRGEVPTVFFGTYLFGCGLSTVAFDFSEIGRIAAEHLVDDCGCRSFVHVGAIMAMRVSMRELFFRQSLAERGHESHAIEMALLQGEASAYPKPHPESPQLEALLRSLPRPIGVLAINDIYARYVVKTCARLGLAVPTDVAVVGVGNSLAAHVHRPRLTSIQPDYNMLGVAGVQLLRRLMASDTSSPQTVLVGGSRLMARESTVGAGEARGAVTVDAALDVIRSHACTGLTVIQLAEALDVSRRSLELLFRAELGTSPLDEIQRVRFGDASRQLKVTALPVATIAERVGFSDVAAFSRFFRRMSGDWPAAHRRGPADTSGAPASGRRRRNVS